MKKSLLWIILILLFINYVASEDYLKYYQKALSLYKKGNIVEAKKILQGAIEIYPDHSPSLKLMGEILVKENKYDDAILYYKRALLVNPKDNEARINLADVYGWQGNYDRAIGLYKEILEEEPENISAMLGLARTLRWAQRFEEAISVYQQILQNESENLEALSGLSKTLAFAGYYSKAIDYINKAIKLNPDNSELLKNKAEILSWQGRYKEAENLYKASLKLNSKDPETYHNLGNLYTWSKQYKKAVEAYEKAIQLDNQNINYLLSLANTYLQWSKPAAAEKVIKKVLKIDPQNQDALKMFQQIRMNPQIDISKIIEKYAEPILILIIMFSILIYYRIKEDILKHKSKFFWIISHYVMPILITLSILGFTFSLWTNLLEPFSTVIADIIELLLFLILGISFFSLIFFQRREKTHSKTYLFLGAHPDDVELGCAGTIAKLKDQGYRIIVIIFSAGEKGGNEDIRKKEAMDACNYLSVDTLRILTFPDTEFPSYLSKIVQEIEYWIKYQKVSTIFVHSPQDIHQDHKTIFEAAKIAARDQYSLISYEDVRTEQDFIPNYFVDITEYIDVKLKAVSFYKSQKEKIYMDLECIKGRAAHRGFQAGVKYAEAFFCHKIIN